MKSITIRNWAHIALFNLFLVACLGLLMRLKILLPIPWIDQRFALHAHSHFAFSGWISHTLMLSVSVALLGIHYDGILPDRYNRLLVFNLFCAYGMLVSFLLQGYAAVSITFSTLSIIVSFIFYRYFQKDSSPAMREEIWWKYIHAALIFNMLSCLGTFSLAWTMVFQPGNTELRLASVYFYLHFQYNGWFFFVCMGLFHHWIYEQKISLPHALIQFRVFVISCIPMYLLSINWMAFPAALYLASILTALAQFTAFCVFAASVWQCRKQIAQHLPSGTRYLLLAVMVAAGIKFGLQTASSIPAIAQLAFGFRPVVIAYLHLVLLGVISLFLIIWLLINNSVKWTVASHRAVWIFVFGVILNELFLMLQGIGSLMGIYISYMPEALALASFVLSGGAAYMFSGSFNLVEKV